MTTGLDSHDNSEFLRQAKAPIGEVIQKYGVPVPLKLDHSDNLDALKQIAASYQNSNRIDDLSALRLLYNAKQDKATLTPIAYYIIHPKSHNFSQVQADKVINLLTPYAQMYLLKEVAKMDQIISTISDKELDYIQELILKNINDPTIEQEVINTLLSLPITLKRELFTFLPDNIKQNLVIKLTQDNFGLDLLNTKQKDFLLGEILTKDFPKSAGMNKFKLAIALQKYPQSHKEERWSAIDNNTKQEALTKFYKEQFVPSTPNIVMLFSDGDKKDLRKYSKIIEDAAARGEKQLHIDEGMKSFFEKIVTLNINSKTNLAALNPGLQSEAIFVLPQIDKNNIHLGARVIMVNNGSIVDLGDANNKFYSSQIPESPGKFQIDADVRDVYDNMHTVSHASKLNHLDEMFYSPENYKIREQISSISVPGFKQPSTYLTNIEMQKGVLQNDQSHSRSRAA